MFFRPSQSFSSGIPLTWHHGLTQFQPQRQPCKAQKIASTSLASVAALSNAHENYTFFHPNTSSLRQRSMKTLPLLIILVSTASPGISADAILASTNNSTLNTILEAGRDYGEARARQKQRDERAERRHERHEREHRQDRDRQKHRRSQYQHR